MRAARPACSPSSRAATPRSPVRSRRSRSAPASATLARADVRLRAPLQPPPQMRDCLCFELHLKQAFAASRKLQAMRSADPDKALAEIERSGLPAAPPIFYEQPIYYKANRFAVIGTDDDVVWPSYSKFLDFELEFGVYIKGKVKDAPREGALAHVFGYTIFNDMSARDAQGVEMEGRLGPAKGKDFDTANPMGPCLVTADEIPDPYNLTMIARVNGEEWGRGNSSSMYWKFEDLISPTSPARRPSIPASSSARARSATAAGSSTCASSSRAT